METTTHATMAGLMHTYVGGGYPEPELSDIALEWMLQMAEVHGLIVYSKHKVEIDGQANGMMHNSRGTMVTRFYRREIRSWPTETHGKPCVHQSVLKRNLTQQNEIDPPCKPWIFDGTYDYETEVWKKLT